MVGHDDLQVQADGEISCQTFAPCPVGAGGGQCTPIQFDNPSDFGSIDDNMNFAVVPFESGTIIYLHHQPVDDDTGQPNKVSATVGIQGIDSSSPVWALAHSYDAASLSSGLAVVFAPPTAQASGIPNECVVPVDLMTFTAE